MSVINLVSFLKELSKEGSFSMDHIIQVKYTIIVVVENAYINKE